MIERGKILAETYESVAFIVTSANTGKNVLRCFQKITKMVMLAKGYIDNTDNLDKSSHSSASFNHQSLPLRVEGKK